jgi:uncharacterized membrane protein
MAKKEKISKKDSNEKACSILSYLVIGIIWFFADETIRKNENVKFHVKQGLVLLILDIIIYLVVQIPIIGWIARPVLWIGFIILLIIGIINAAKGEQKELPLIGHLASNFKF